MRWMSANIKMLLESENEFSKNLRKDIRGMGHKVETVLLEELVIDERILDHDCLLLLSPHLFFIYAGLYAGSRGINVIPDPDVFRRMSNRTELPFMARKANIGTSRTFMGFPDALGRQLHPDDFPLLSRPIVGSVSDRNARLGSAKDLSGREDRFLILEKVTAGRPVRIIYVGDSVYVYLGHDDGDRDSDSNSNSDSDSDSGGKSEWTELPSSTYQTLYRIARDLVEKWIDATGCEFGFLEVVWDEPREICTLAEAGVYPTWITGRKIPTEIGKLLFELSQS